MKSYIIIGITVVAIGVAGYFGHSQYTKVQARKAAEARHQAWLAASVRCEGEACFRRFLPEKNKAPLTTSILAGAAGGAATGGIGGAKLGGGTGVVVGGAPGGLAGSTVAGTGGLLAGGVIGGVSGAWYADGRVQCPYCLHVFKNPKN